MLADASTVLGPIAAFAFVLFAIGFVLYALVRPFTHLHYHRSGSGQLWQHLP
jgi:hypothetical protein